MFTDSFSDFCLKALEEAISTPTACEILTLLEEQYENDNSSVVDIVNKCYKYLCSELFCNYHLLKDVRYIVNNLRAIILEDTLYVLSSDTFQSILQNPSLACLEINLYSAVLSWHHHHYGDFNNHRESLLLHLSMLDLKLIDLNSLAERVHASGVFSKDEMAELYRLRITLGQLDHNSRAERKVYKGGARKKDANNIIQFAIVFHGGSDYTSRPNDVIVSLGKAGMSTNPPEIIPHYNDLFILYSGIDLCTSDVIDIGNGCTLTYRDLQQYSAVLLFSMETRTQVYYLFLSLPHFPFLFFFLFIYIRGVAVMCSQTMWTEEAAS